MTTETTEVEQALTSTSSAGGPVGDRSVRSLGDVAARGAGLTLATQGVRAVLQFTSIVVLARLLTPRDFGLIAMVTAVIGIADLVRDFGLSSAAIQAKVVTDDERTNLVWANVALGAACSAVAVAVAPLVVAAYGEPRLLRVVLALSGVFVVSGLNTQFRADLTRQLRFSALAISDIASQASGILVAVALAWHGAGYWAIVAQQLTAAVVSCAVNMYSAPWLPGLPRRGVSLSRFFKFGRGLLGTQSIYYVTKNVDNFALGVFAGAVPLGLYSRAYQLLMTPLNTINAPMTRVALPVLSRAQDDDERFASYLAKVQLVACYLTATVFTVAAGLSGPLVLVLFGRNWSGVAPIFAVLALGGIFRAISQVAYWIYLSKGVPGAQFRMFLWTGPVMVCLILAGLPWGPVGVAVGHFAAYFFQWAVSLWHVGRVSRLDVRPLVRNSVRAVTLVSVPCGCAAFLATFLSAPPLLQVLGGVALAGCYLLLAQRLLPAVRTDTALVLSFVRRAVRR